MVGKRQFSLSYLFGEISLLGTGLAIARWTVLNYDRYDTVLWLTAVGVGLACFGAAIGGLFGGMKEGAICGLAVYFVGVLVAPINH
jgi:hypothetical protein